MRTITFATIYCIEHSQHQKLAHFHLLSTVSQVSPNMVGMPKSWCGCYIVALASMPCNQDETVTTTGRSPGFLQVRGFHWSECSSSGIQVVTGKDSTQGASIQGKSYFKHSTLMGNNQSHVLVYLTSSTNSIFFDFE